MCLYHYTRLDAFVSIVKDQELQFTNIHFLNDYMESRLFLATAADLMREHAASAKTDGMRAMYQLGADVLERPGFEHVYCCCFSRLEDDLGQWRAYADDGRGVAIGFDVDEIQRQNISRSGDIKCRTVDYGDEQHRRTAELAISRAFAKTDETANAASLKSRILAAWLRYYLAHEGVGIKAKEFESEQEERLIFDGIAADPVSDPDHFFTNADLKLDFRVRKNVIVPFVRVLAPRTSIRRVVLGPCFGVGENEVSLRMFLGMWGAEGVNIDVQRSRATYRNP